MLRRVAGVLAIASCLWAPILATEAESAKAQEGATPQKQQADQGVPEFTPHIPMASPMAAAYPNQPQPVMPILPEVSGPAGNANFASQFPAFAGYPSPFGPYGVPSWGWGSTWGWPSWGYGDYGGMGMFGGGYGSYMYPYGGFGGYYGIGAEIGGGMPYSYPATPWYGYATQTPAMGAWVTQPPEVPENPANKSQPTGFAKKGYPYGAYATPYAYPAGLPGYPILSRAVHQLTLGIEAAMPVNMWAAPQVLSNAFSTYITANDPSAMPEALLPSNSQAGWGSRRPDFPGFGGHVVGGQYIMAP